MMFKRIQNKRPGYYRLFLVFLAHVKEFRPRLFTHRQRGAIAAVVWYGCGEGRGPRREGWSQRGEGRGQGRVTAAPDQEGCVWEDIGRSQKVDGEKTKYFDLNQLEGFK